MAMSASERLDAIWDAARAQAKSHDITLKTVGVFTTFVFPILLGLLISYEKELFGEEAAAFLIVLSLLIITQIVFGTFLIFSTKSTYDIFANAKALKDEYKLNLNLLVATDQDLKIQTFLAHYSESWMKQIPLFTKNLAEDAGSLKDVFDDMFAPLTSVEDSIFELHSKEHIKFVLYLFRSGSDDLAPFWKQETTSGRKILEEKSRCWGSGQGHVGLAFSKNETICTPDATVQNMVDLFRAPDPKRKDSDNEMYKSFISVPLDGYGDGPYGVLVGTSNKVERFSKETYSPFVLALAAATEAMFAGLNLDEIISQNEPV